LITKTSWQQRLFKKSGKEDEAERLYNTEFQQREHIIQVLNSNLYSPSTCPDPGILF